MLISPHSPVLKDPRLMGFFLKIHSLENADVCLLRKEMDARQSGFAQGNDKYCLPAVKRSACVCLNRALVCFHVCARSAPGGEADGEGEAQAAFSAQPAGA